MSLRSVKKKNEQAKTRCSRIAALVDCDDNVQALCDRQKNGPATDVVFVDGKLKVVYQGAS